SSDLKASTHTSPAADELVVYEKGKVIFRMKPAPAKFDPAKRQAKPDSTRQDSDSVVEASSTTRIAPTKLATTKIAPTKIATTKIATPKIAQAQSVWLSPAQAEARLLNRTDPQYPATALPSHPPAR